MLPFILCENYCGNRELLEITLVLHFVTLFSISAFLINLLNLLNLLDYFGIN